MRGAGGRTRTDMSVEGRRILSPLRLPIPPRPRGAARERNEGDCPAAPLQQPKVAMPCFGWFVQSL
jgi:hypothetical protein